MNKVQEALKNLIEFVEQMAVFTPRDYDQIGVDIVNAGKSALSEIDKCEPVGEVIETKYADFMPDTSMLKVVKWIDKDFEVGTKFYTSPISKEWVGLPDTEHSRVIWECTKLNQNLRDDLETFTYVLNATKAIEAKLKSLNAPPDKE